MQWFMQWRAQAVIGLIGGIVSVPITADRGGLPGIALAIFAAACWTNATRLYIAENG